MGKPSISTQGLMPKVALGVIIALACCRAVAQEPSPVEPQPSIVSNETLSARLARGEDEVAKGDIDTAYGIFEQLVREQPANPQANFAYGMACFSMKRYSHAALAFERALSVNADDGRAWIMLGRSALANKQYSAASEHLEKALSLNPPEPDRVNIKSYLKEARKGSKMWGFSVRADVGVFNDDNVNVGPDATTINIAPIIQGVTTITNLTVQESSQPVEVLGAYMSLGLSSYYDIGERGTWFLFADGAYYQNWLDSASWFLFADGAYHQNWLDSASPCESMLGQAAVGARRTAQRTFLSVPFKASAINYGHAALMNIYGIAPTFTWVLGQKGNLHWTSQFTAESRDWIQRDTRDSTYVAVEETARYFFGRRGDSVSAGVSLHRDNAMTNCYDQTGVSCSLGIEVKLPWQVTMYGKSRYTALDFAEREPLAPEPRSDTQLQLGIGVRRPFGGRYGLDLGYQYTDNNSTFGLYQYQRNVTTLGLSGSF